MTDSELKDKVIGALARIVHPGMNRPIVELGMVRNTQVNEGRVSFDLVFSNPSGDFNKKIEEACETNLIVLPGVKSVDVHTVYDTSKPATASLDEEKIIHGVKRAIAIGSGKGGVGKSTVAANLAVTLAARGLSVGLLDADMYGPSIPIMFGVTSPVAVTKSGGIEKMVPPEAHGVKLMSVGFIVDDTKALIWRGPILHQVVVQFLRDVMWGELDVMIIDLPPGTGDVQISLSQKLDVSGAVIVSTPQDVAMADVVRAKNMFDATKVPVLGLVQNMSEFRAPDGRTYRIFAGPSLDEAAEKLGVPGLGAIPIDPAVGLSGDRGTPLMADASNEGTSVWNAFNDIADTILASVPPAAGA